MAEDGCTVASLEKLAEDDLAVLLGLAGLGLPTSNSHLARVMAGARGFPQAQAWAANPRLIQERLLHLQSLGLAETTRQGYWICAGRALEPAARMAFAKGLLRRLHQGAITGSYGSVAPDARARILAELRLAFLEGSHERWLPLRERFSQQFGETIRFRDPLAIICGGPFEPAWFEALPPGAQAYGCQALLLDQVLLGLRSPAFLAWMGTQAGTPRPAQSALTILLFLALQARTGEMGPWMALQPPGLRGGYAWSALEGLMALASGDPARSASCFGESAARLQKASGRPDPLLPGPYEPFHILALLARGEARDRVKARERIARLGRRHREDPAQPVAESLGRLAMTLAGGRPAPARTGTPGRLTPAATAFTQFMEILCAYLAGEPLAPNQLDRACRACAPLPLAWFSAALGELRTRLQGGPAQPDPLLDLIPQKAAWERALDSLQRLGGPEPPC